MALRSGRLTYFGTLKKRASNRNEYGELVPGAWTAVTNVWFSFEQASAAEGEVGGRERGEVSGNIILRNIPGITAGMIIECGSKTYVLESAPMENITRDAITIQASLK